MYIKWALLFMHLSIIDNLGNIDNMKSGVFTGMKPRVQNRSSVASLFLGQGWQSSLLLVDSGKDKENRSI